ncbi:MAG: magnesium transporter CorA family protein [Lactobacillus sp.]|jgi:magnesium transporter|nr:magnesium transporter CorA family protein [Lactobacillus sp.]MCH3905914.1 magnesium transporter CorA family protein [Lactobacillus sp.]MCI1467259.1 magnesium transporter CorA family protein [Lactobacillus sp.]MCI1481523.1 magnesium transporter CorA family protein [Lactobacillus sp.]MCI1883468.1 magnesium transporter CorA family protein [Lactobacillus sp.]
MIEQHSLNFKSHWVSVNEPTPHEMNALVEKYGVTEELLRYAVDPYEKARVEVDMEAGVTLLIFDVVLPTHDVSEPETAPVGMMIARDNILTFTSEPTSFINKQLTGKIDKLRAAGKQVGNIDFIIQVLYDFTTAYFVPIRRSDGDRQRMQRNLQKNMDRNAITKLMEIETGLVYILSSAQGNISLLQEFKRRFKNTLTEDQLENLDDVIIEAQQGLEMAQMASTLAQRVSSAYNKVLDSRLNETMRFLTVYSIILSIPPIVSGFYGENVKLPLADASWSWQFTIIITLVLIVLSIWFIFNKHFWK